VLVPTNGVSCGASSALITTVTAYDDGTYSIA
jgi:hypothetical protein